MLKLMVIGRLGKDAEVKEVNGRKVIDFPLAHSMRVRSMAAGGEKVEKITWINCSYWTDYTNLLGLLKKGKLVYVEGLPDASGYMKEGVPTGSLRLRVSSLELLWNKYEDGADGYPYHNATRNYTPSATGVSNTPNTTTTAKTTEESTKTTEQSTTEEKPPTNTASDDVI